MKKITVPKIALLVASPVTIGCVTLFVSCSKAEEIIAESTILQANSAGSAEIKLTFPEQPQFDKAIVSIEHIGGKQIEIVSGIKEYGNTQTIDINKKQCKIVVQFSETQLENASSNFNLWISYIKPNNEFVKVPIKNMVLKIKVDPSVLKDELHILSINDFHGAAPGYGDQKVSANIKEPGAIRLMNTAGTILSNYPGSIFVSAGDNNSGTAFSASTHGANLFPVLKSMGVRYSAVGNHAFEWGLDYLSGEKFDTWARTPYTNDHYFLAANILSNPNYKEKQWIINKTDPGYNDDFLIWQNQCVRWADPYKIVNMKGHKFCLIGLTTQQTYNDGNQDVAKHLSFIDYNAAVHYAKDKCLMDLGQQEYSAIESFILLTHVESDSDDFGQPISTAAYLGKTITSDIDAIISGHSHKTVAGKVHNDQLAKDIWIGQAGSSGKQLLDIKMELDNTRPIGRRIKDMSMVIHDIPIDYGGVNPETKDPAEKAKAKKAATEEYQKIITNPTLSSVKTVVNSLSENEDEVNLKLKEQLALSSEGADYTLPPGAELGHQWIEFDNIIAQMGAWHNKATLLGFADLFCKGSEPTIPLKPAITFINQDSIRHSWEKNHMVTLGDIFQTQTYENTTYYGYLTINQIANIIDYMIADGSTKFVYPPENAGKYTGRLDTDYMGKPCVKNDVTLEPNGTATKKDVSAYLCGPLQWYGMKFEVESKKDVPGYDWDRKWQLKYITEEVEIETGVKKTITYPCIWFYDPLDSTTTLDNPDTWVSARTYKIKEEKEKFTKFFGATINSFVFTGQNYANRMFKHYMEYNAQLEPSYQPVLLSQITRELLIDFCRNWESLSNKFDISETDAKKLVIFPTNN